MARFKKGDRVKLMRGEGLSQYGLQKGDVGVVVGTAKFMGKSAYRIKVNRKGPFSFFPDELMLVERSRK